MHGNARLTPNGQIAIHQQVADTVVGSNSGLTIYTLEGPVAHVPWANLDAAQAAITPQRQAGIGRIRETARDHPVWAITPIVPTVRYRHFREWLGTAGSARSGVRHITLDDK